MRFFITIYMEMYDCRIVSKKRRGNNNKYKLFKNNSNNYTL